MPTREEILVILDKLENCCADQLEGQTLDFKEWNSKSYKDTGALILEAVICLANGGGGTVVVGVNDKAIGRAKAILGVPPDVDTNVLRKMIYDNTDPKLTPTVEEVTVPEGTGRLILFQVYPGMPPYTDKKGGAKVRVGKDCQPLTGSMRRNLLAAAGDSDLSAEELPGSVEDLISPGGMEKLRAIAAKQNAPKELLGKTDSDLLAALGLVRNGRLIKAGLLLVGREDKIAEVFPSYAWSYLKMAASGSDYTDRADGRECIALALGRIEDRVMAHNPLTTMKQGLLHFEYRTYPEIAIREALMNAFAHSDYRIPGLIQVKQFDDRLEIANPGALVGGVAPDNILRHTPVSRNAALVNALIPLRLVNRSNLGMHRMFEAMLQEGKEPPILREVGDSVRMIFLRNDFSFPFRAYVAEVASNGSLLTLEELLVIHYLLRHGEIDEVTASEICQQELREARETLRRMERKNVLSCVRRQGELVFQLLPDVEAAISPSSNDGGAPSKIDIASSKILSTLRKLHQDGKAGLTNAQLRELTGLDRDQVKYVMQRLREQGSVLSSGRGRAASWAVK